MTLKGSAVAKAPAPVVQPIVGVDIHLDDAGEIRRLGRILTSFLSTSSTARGPRTDAFARDMIAALGYTAENTAKV